MTITRVTAVLALLAYLIVVVAVFAGIVNGQHSLVWVLAAFAMIVGGIAVASIATNRTK
jgi:hypothetical protein